MANRNLTIRKQTEIVPANAQFRKMSEIIIADKSASMNAAVAQLDDRAAPTRRIDAVNEAISSYGAHIQTIAFSHTVTTHTGLVTLEPSGSTAMHLALEEAKKYEPTYLLVLSDGQVDYPDKTLQIARELAELAIIDTLYIGPDDDSAEKFMRDLAEIGHGRFRRYDMTKPQQLLLESVIKGLLPMPSGTGQIEL
jgi:hypothetical protein